MAPANHDPAFWKATIRGCQFVTIVLVISEKEREGERASEVMDGRGEVMRYRVANWVPLKVCSPPISQGRKL